MPRVKRVLSSYHKSAFTLIELTILLAIVALLATVTISSFTFLKRSLVRLELNRIQNALNYTRQLAIATQQTQTVKFNLQDHSYRYGIYHTQLNSATRFGTAPHIYGPPADPQTLITSPVTFANQQATIDQNGLISPGAIYVTDLARSITYALTVPISQATLMRKYRQSGRKWERI